MHIGMVYWSGTGNTEAMTNYIAEGMRAAGATVEILPVSQCSAVQALTYDALALGCPSMGVEELEDGEFLPFYEKLEPSLSHRNLALFGSYGWGDGEWMRSWRQRAIESGAQVFESDLIVQEAPDATAKEACFHFGERFARSLEE